MKLSISIENIHLIKYSALHNFMMVTFLMHENHFVESVNMEYKVKKFENLKKIHKSCFIIKHPIFVCHSNYDSTGY